MARSTKSKRPSVSIVGAGRLGSALAVALNGAGYTLNAVVARRKANAQKVTVLLDGRTLALAGNQLAKLPQSQLIIIATPDDAIEQIASTLADLHTVNGGGRFVLHTSGALSSAVLSRLKNRGFATGSLHPLLAVSDRQRGVQSWRGVFWCVEGDRKALTLGRRIVSDLKGHSFSVSSKDKPLYHAAALMVSGQVVALFDVAIEMLVKSGLSPSAARRILLPLIESNSRNLARFDPAHALTGTFARGDAETVQRHLAALSESRLSDAIALYRILGLRSLRLSQSVKGNSQTARQIKNLLMK
jgi:predicted short-subunit dehydrogenase-like oxidoreductase (DUF2520 family)